MTKLLLLVSFILTGIGMSAQTTLKAQSIYDVNQDDQVSISDVNTVVKKLVENTTTDKTVVDTEALLKVLNALNAKIDALSSLSTEIASLKSDLAKVKEKLGIEGEEEKEEEEEEESTSNLLPGKFSVSATKQVQFTKSNLYWNGSAFKFEANQTDYPTEWDANHVGHFFWTNLSDYLSGRAAYMPYAASYNYISQSTGDKFWCGSDNPLTVEGTSGLYVLTGSSGEWKYLIYSRTNASSLYKYPVTVTNSGTDYANCLIIAPDDFTGTLQSNYTLDEVNAAGFVCIPASGYRKDSEIKQVGENVCIWTATPYPQTYHNLAYTMSNFNMNSAVNTTGRDDGSCIRLVRNVEE